VLQQGYDEKPLIRPDTPNQGQPLISLGEDARLEGNKAKFKPCIAPRSGWRKIAHGGCVWLAGKEKPLILGIRGCAQALEDCGELFQAAHSAILLAITVDLLA